MALEMKALDELNVMILDFVNKHITKVDTVQPGLDAYCEWETNDCTGKVTISYPVVSCYHSDRLYVEYLKELGLDTNRFNVWFTTLLHEVFHAVTIDSFDIWARIRHQHSLDDVDAMEDEDARTRTYFRLPIEAAATKGAVDFILNNKDLCEIFQGKCVAKMTEFYNANDVIDEDAFAE